MAEPEKDTAASGPAHQRGAAFVDVVEFDEPGRSLKSMLGSMSRNSVITAFELVATLFREPRAK